MKMTKCRSSTNKPVTAGNLRNEKDLPEMLENSYMFMKKIKGTLAYSHNMLYDLLAMFRCLGPPTLFMTLSADDLHWPEQGMTLDGLNLEDAYSRSYFSSVRNDPVLTATHFERQFRSLRKNVILGDLHPLGQVKYYFARVEFQNRRSLHIHMFLWVADVPYVIDDITAPVMIAYIDKSVCSCLPDVNSDLELYHVVTR